VSRAGHALGVAMCRPGGQRKDSRARAGMTKSRAGHALGGGCAGRQASTKIPEQARE
jgi:hypothetical protein